MGVDWLQLNGAGDVLIDIQMSREVLYFQLLDLFQIYDERSLAGVCRVAGAVGQAGPGHLCSIGQYERSLKYWPMC